MVLPGRLERPTAPLGRDRSIQLSYGSPVHILAPLLYDLNQAGCRSSVDRTVRDGEALGSIPSTPTKREKESVVEEASCVLLSMRC